MSAPSGYRIEQAMSVAMSLKQRLLQEDPDLALDETLLRDTLEGETDVYDLMRRLARFTLDAEAMAKAAKERADSLATRRQRYERRAADARGALFAMMEALEQRKIEDAEFTISIRAGSKSTIVTDEASLPEEFWHVSRSVDKAAIGAALKAGTEVPGAFLSNGLPSLLLKAT